MATRPNLIRAIPKTKIKAFDYNYNFDQFQSYVDEVIGDVSGSMPVGAIYQAIRTDVPVNSLRLDGQEFTSGFDNFILNYLISGKIITKSYVEWQEEYDNNGGNVGFFAYDADTGKFKVPCIQSGTFLAQAVASGEFGSFLNSEIKSHTHVWTGNTNVAGSHVHSLGNTTANDDGGVYITSGNNTDQGIVNTQYAGDHSHTVAGTNDYTGGDDTYPKHIKYPFFVVVSNVEAESPSQVVWDTFVGNLDTKLSRENKEEITSWSFPSNVFTDLTLGVSGTQYTAPANGWVHILKLSNGVGQYLTLRNVTKNISIRANNTSNAVDQSGLLIPVSKNDIYSVVYTYSGTTNNFRFIYAESEVA